MIAEASKLIEKLEKENKTIGAYALEQEMLQSGRSKEAVLEQMQASLQVMRHSGTAARKEPVYSVSGLTGGNAHRYEAYRLSGKSLLGDTASLAASMALSCSEQNASMQCIVACPTAGSCGIVPAVILSCGEVHRLSEDTLLEGLFTASAVGMIIGARATLAGAEGGCQAECGAAAAMGAAAVTEMMGGSPAQAFHAGAMALKNVLGLTCDPVAGLVEIPCVKRNASGAINALISADMALAGVESYIPFDQVVDAMYAVGKAMPAALRETAAGGLAVTPAALQMAAKLK